MKTNNQLAERFGEILIRKMEEMKSEKWEKPWFDVSGKINFYPQNYTGREYKRLSVAAVGIACYFPFKLHQSLCGAERLNYH